MMREEVTPSLRRPLVRLVPVLALLALAACAGTTDAGPRIEVESAWARPSLAPIGHMDDHDHMDHHGPGEAKAEQEEEHGEDYADMAAHHQSSGSTSAVYFVLRNRGGEADRLIAARTEVASAVELHQSAVEDGVMRMRQVESVEVPARGEARLEPGGYHLMLIGLNRELKDGDSFAVTLEFERTGARVVEVVVGVQ